MYSFYSDNIYIFFKVSFNMDFSALKSVKAIGFDWSGTVSDDKMPVFGSNNTLFTKYGVSTYPSVEEWQKNATASLYQRIVNEVGQTCPSKEVVHADYLEAYSQELAKGNVPYIFSGMKELFAHLKQNEISVSIISSHPQVFVNNEIRSYGLEELLDLSLVFGDINDKKTKIEQVVSQLNIPASNFLYVGDTQSDIYSARNARVLSCAVYKDGYHSLEKLEKANPQYIFERASELILHI